MPALSQIQSFHDIHIAGSGNSLVINQIIQISVAEIKTRPLLTSSPYLGLRRFDGKHHQFFFGRDQFVARLLNSLAQRNLLAVLGPSGSGKSSVVRAGLIPQLDERFPKGRFHSITFSPDRDPFLSLRSGLYEGAGISFSRSDAIRPSPQALLDMSATLRAEDEQWLLFIDQFEEIFTLCTEERVRVAFLEALALLASQPQQEVKLVLAMRADFLGHLGPYPQLAALVEQGLHLLTDMQPSGLRAAIEQPAARHGIVFEEGLVEQIIKDVQHRPGSLPLLQYTLDLLWKKDDDLNDRTLNTVTYHRLGGVEGALRDQAEELYNWTQRGNKKVARPPEQQEAIRRIFLRLVDYSSDAEPRPVSKRTALREFSLPGEQELVTEFIDRKLLISSSDVRIAEGKAGITLGAATVELAHEALINAWPRLKEWLERTKDVLFLYNRLKTDAGKWKETATRNPREAEAELWSGSRLQQAMELRQQGEFSRMLSGLSEAESAFLDAGVELRDRRSLEEDERRLRKLQALQKELDEQVERGRKLLLNDRPIEALLWLHEAQRRGSENPMLPYLLASAVRPLDATKAVFVGHEGPVNCVRFSPDDRTVATGGQDGTARIWDVATSQQRLLLSGHVGSVNRVEFHRSGGHLLTAGADHAARIWDTQDGREIACLKGHCAALTAACYSRCGRYVLTASQDHTACLWDADSGGLLHAFLGHKGAVCAAAISGDSRFVVTASDDRTVRVWSAKTGEQVADLCPAAEPQGAALCVAIDIVSKQIVVGYEVGRVCIWEVETWKLIAEWSDFSGPIDYVELAPHTEELAILLRDGQPKRMDWRTGYSRQPEGVSPVHKLTFSPDGDGLLSAHADGSVRLGRRSLYVHSSAVVDVHSSSDGLLLASASADGTARVTSALDSSVIGRMMPPVQSTGTEYIRFSTHADALFIFDGKCIVDSASLRVLELPFADDKIEEIETASDGDLEIRIQQDGKVESFKFSEIVKTSNQYNTAQIVDPHLAQKAETNETSNRDLLFSLKESDSSINTKFSCMNDQFLFLAREIRGSYVLEIRTREWLRPVAKVVVAEPRVVEVKFLGDEVLAAVSSRMYVDCYEMKSETLISRIEHIESGRGQEEIFFSVNGDSIFLYKDKKESDRPVPGLDHSPVFMYSTKTGRLMFTFTLPRGYDRKISRIFLTPDDTRLYVIDKWFSVFVFDIGKELRSPETLNLLIKGRSPWRLDRMGARIAPALPEPQVATAIQPRIEADPKLNIEIDRLGMAVTCVRTRELDAAKRHAEAARARADWICDDRQRARLLLIDAAIARLAGSDALVEDYLPKILKLITRCHRGEFYLSESWSFDLSEFAADKLNLFDYAAELYWQVIQPCLDTDSPSNAGDKFAHFVLALLSCSKEDSRIDYIWQKLNEVRPGVKTAIDWIDSKFHYITWVMLTMSGKKDAVEQLIGVLLHRYETRAYDAFDSGLCLAGLRCRIKENPTGLHTPTYVLRAIEILSRPKSDSAEVELRSLLELSLKDRNPSLQPPSQ